MSVTESSSYKVIFKATSLFGGVQVYNILIGIVKSKFIAVLLGPAGMGITGLLTSATSLVQGFTAMGLSSSAVKNIAEAFGSGNEERLSNIVAAFKKLVWVTGLFGVIVTILISPMLSKYSFGNYDYTIPFIFLSITLLLQQLSAGQSVLLQGTRKLKHLAKSSILGSTIGLLISVPIYYIFGISGIVPTLILNAVTTLMLTWWFAKSIPIEKHKVSSKRAFLEGKEMLRMGLVMSLNSVLVLGVSYILRAYISNAGGIEEVGLFSAGHTIVSTYVGLVFTAMTTDYYPRLAAVNKDSIKTMSVVNQQAEIAVLILSPMLVAFLLIMPTIVLILYSDKFVGANGYMQWAILGMPFKTAAWAIAYQFIAKGESKVFAINELIANAYILILSIVGYSIYGLDGLGISFALTNLLYLLQVFYVARNKYQFKFSSSFNKVFYFQLLLLVLCFLNVLFVNGFFLYITGFALVMLSSFFAFKGLDKRIGLVIYFKDYLRKK